MEHLTAESLHVVKGFPFEYILTADYMEEGEKNYLTSYIGNYNYLSH
jgi:hypothetical protein